MRRDCLTRRTFLIFRKVGLHKPLKDSRPRLAVCRCIPHNTIMSEVMTIRVDRKTKTRLEKLAKAMDRTNSYVAAEAIRAFVELNEWQIAEIKAALKEADAGDFASAKEVQTVVKKWSRRARKMA